MSRYKIKKIQEFISIKHGFPFKSEFFSNSGKWVVVTPGNFYEAGGFKREVGKEKFYISEILQEYIFKKNDLIVAMTEQAAGLLGSCALIPEDNVYLHNQRIGLITTNKQYLDSNFFYYASQTNFFREQIRLTSSGSKVKHTSPSRLAASRIPLPEIETQQKIAAVLSALDKKIDCNNRINAELEAMAKTLYDYYFVQFDFPDVNGKPYKSSGGKMVYDAELKREIPAGWEVKRISELLNVVTGKEDANFSCPNGKYKFFSCSQTALYCDSPVFEGNAVLIAGNGNFNVKHYSGKFNAYQRTYVLLSPKDLYALLYITVKGMVEKFTIGSNGSIIKFIKKADVDTITVAYPPNKKTCEKLNEYLFLIEKHEEENEKLAKLRDWLLPMLMNGQATVE